MAPSRDPQVIVHVGNMWWNPRLPAATPYSPSDAADSGSNGGGSLADIQGEWVIAPELGLLGDTASRCWAWNLVRTCRGFRCVKLQTSQLSVLRLPLPLATSLLLTLCCRHARFACFAAVGSKRQSSDLDSCGTGAVTSIGSPLLRRTATQRVGFRGR